MGDLLLVLPHCLKGVGGAPPRRARRTAELADFMGALLCDDLHEWDHGGYEGMTTVDIHRTRPDWHLWTDGVPPGPAGHPGESPAEVGRRPDRVPARVDEALPDGDAVLVAHAHFLRVLTAQVPGSPARRGAAVPAGHRGMERTAPGV